MDKWKSFCRSVNSVLHLQLFKVDMLQGLFNMKKIKYRVIFAKQIRVRFLKMYKDLQDNGRQ